MHLIFYTGYRDRLSDKLVESEFILLFETKYTEIYIFLIYFHIYDVHR